MLLGGALREGVVEEGVCVAGFLMEPQRSWRGSSWAYTCKYSRLRGRICELMLCFRISSLLPQNS